MRVFSTFFAACDVSESNLESMDDEEADAHQGKMELIHDLAQMMCDEVIPYSLEHYLGIKMDDMEGEEDDDF
jgi:hypothetical protein